jgi:DNA-nicking Smr family endonuclease
VTGKRKSRAPSVEERELFEAAFKDVTPLRVQPAPPAKATPPKPVAPVPVPPPRQNQPSGLDGRTAERLKRGALTPEGRLDLHGMTEIAAHRALTTFVRGASARGLRLVIVVTGKGAKPAAPDEPFDLELDRRTRGVLKAMTPRWLGEPALAGLVADVRSAHRQHGGTGALYVYLRKSRA